MATTTEHSLEERVNVDLSELRGGTRSVGDLLGRARFVHVIDDSGKTRAVVARAPFGRDELEDPDEP